MRTGTYVYAIVRRRSPDQSSAAGPGGPAHLPTGPGVPGAGPLRLLNLAGAVSLLVADVPAAGYAHAAVEKRLRDMRWLARCARAHEAVAERCAAAGPLLPLKLFAVFKDDAAACASVAPQLPRWRSLLRRVEGRAEWSVRLRPLPRGPRTLPAQASQASQRWRASQRSRTVPVPARAARLATPGTRFLLAKRREQRERGRFVQNARLLAERLFRRLSSIAADARRQASAHRALLDAAFLVDTDRSPQFRREAQRLVGSCARAGFRLELTGPWPAHSFVE